MEVFLQGQRVIAPGERIHPLHCPIQTHFPEEGRILGESRGFFPIWSRGLPPDVEPFPLAVLWSYCVLESRGSSSAAGVHSQPGRQPTHSSNLPWPTLPAASACLAPPAPGSLQGSGSRVCCDLPSLLPGSSGPAAWGWECVHLGGAASLGGAPRPRRLAARRVLAAEPGEERPRLS